MGARNAQPDFQIPIVISLLLGPQQMRCKVVWAPKWPRQSIRGTSERSRRVNCAHSGVRGGRRCGVRFRVRTGIWMFCDVLFVSCHSYCMQTCPGGRYFRKFLWLLSKETSSLLKIESRVNERIEISKTQIFNKLSTQPYDHTSYYKLYDLHPTLGSHKLLQSLYDLHPTLGSHKLLQSLRSSPNLKIT